jgi:CO/xanthine dehydrogenase Mo-binding subunit
MLDTVMVEVPNPKHPQGVMGVGEVPFVPVMAAVANDGFAAVCSATRIRGWNVPTTPRLRPVPFAKIFPFPFDPNQI